MADVGTGLLLVLLREMLDNSVIEIFNTEMGVAGCCEDLEDAVVDGEEGEVDVPPPRS